MAQVAPDRDLWARIDRDLDYLLREWDGVSALVDDWDEWDEHSRLVFSLDWPICEDRLSRMQQWAEQGRLTAEQRVRYGQLLSLVKQQRPVLERLLSA